MGGPMAANIASAGLPVRVWNRTEEKARAVAEEAESCSVSESPAAAVGGADVVATMLTDVDAVEQVMTGEGGALDAVRDDAVWLQMSTVGIAGQERLAALAEKRGVAFVDAPVLGTKQPAEQGQLTVLAAGPAEAIERARPALDAVAAKVVELGEPGAGMRTKLMLNHWVLSLVEAIAETIALGEALEVDPQRFLEIIEGGPLDSQYAQMKGKAILERALAPAFPLSGALKDSGLIVEAAAGAGFEAALAETIARKMQQAVDAGHGDEDIAATYYASAKDAAGAR
jgi:3-hydroxyisobutyrate dehydrogenase